MPRFKPKGILERDPVADVWKRTLSRIPTLYGRVAYLASLRDQNSGAYRHHGLTASFGRDEGTRALRESHEQAFAEWLNLSLAEKSADLQSYLAALEDPMPEVVEHWLSPGYLQTLIPAAARKASRELFRSDLETLLKLLRRATRRG